MKKIIALTIVFVLSMAMVLPVHATVQDDYAQAISDALQIYRDNPYYHNVPDLARIKYYIGNYEYAYLALNNTSRNDLGINEDWYVFVLLSNVKLEAVGCQIQGGSFLRLSSATADIKDNGYYFVDYFGNPWQHLDRFYFSEINLVPTYSYSIKFRNEADVVHTYDFDQKPIYFGSGTNWMLVKANGKYKEDGVVKTASDTIFKIQNLISKNFDIKDAQGNTVYGLKKNSKIRPLGSGSTMYLDTYYSKVQWYLTTSNTPINTYSEQNSITNQYNVGFDMVDGFAVIRAADLSKWSITSNTWQITDTSGGGTNPPEYEDAGEKPVRENYEDGIFGTVAYLLDMLGYYAKQPFVYIAKAIQETISTIGLMTENLTGVTGWLGKLFSFLPPEVVGLITGCISITCLVTVIRAVRK